MSVGDIVLIHESSPLKGQYCLGIVKEVKPSKDRLVRSCVVEYTIPYIKGSGGNYGRGKKITVTRSVQRLTLILPVEEQSRNLVVEGDKVMLE